MPGATASELSERITALDEAVDKWLERFRTPALDRVKSGRQLIEQGRPFLDAADEVFLFRSDYSGVYNLFSGRLRMPVVDEGKALEAKLLAPRRIAVIARERHLERLAGLPLHIAVRERVGSKRMVLLVNWQPARSLEAPSVERRRAQPQE